MQTLNQAVMYFLSFKPYVLLPVIIFALAMVFRIKLVTAIKSALSIGIGFIGIFMIFDYFVNIIHPVVEALIRRAGLHFNVLDTGWPPLSVITWSFQLAPLLVAALLGINIVMLVLRWTKTVDIDIWNYWHVILGAAMVYHVTDSVWLAITAAVVAFVMVLKLAEWSAPMVNKFSGMEGICIPHLSGIGYFPLSLLGNWLIERAPGLNKIDANPEKIAEKLGLIGEPMIIGFIMGVALGIGGGYSFKQTAELAFEFAAVIFILPKMCGILGSALIPVSEGMKNFINRHFPDMGQTFIGLDVAVLFGAPSVIVTALLLIPTSIFLAFVLPGVKFIPLGDLTNLMVPVAFIAVATRGNVVRSFLIGIPVVIANLYIGSALAPLFARMAADAHYQVAGYKGLFTSFLDGGNIFRAWLLDAFRGGWIGLALIPVVILLMVYTWGATKGEAGI